MTAPALKDKADKADPDKAGLAKLPKAKLIAMILEQREDARIRLEAKDQQITELSEQLAKLQEKIDKKKAKQKIKEINQQVNQPTSKKPEWDKHGNPKPATTGQHMGDFGTRLASLSGRPRLRLHRCQVSIDDR